jgi:hypothetical protein
LDQHTGRRRNVLWGVAGYDEQSDFVAVDTGGSDCFTRSFFGEIRAGFFDATKVGDVPRCNAQLGLGALGIEFNVCQLP